jgi:hypothetical protein
MRAGPYKFVPIPVGDVVAPPPIARVIPTYAPGTAPPAPIGWNTRALDLGPATITWGTVAIVAAVGAGLYLLTKGA